MTESEPLQAAIAALEAQRALLGNAVVDAALGPMREQLARLSTPVPGAPAEQALKQVSVLFLDVVGSTALSQHLDPEDVHAVMDGALARCTEVVLAHGGKVLQYAGDNLLAAFGAGGAQEDDAERAVRCGLALLACGRDMRQQVLREHGQDGCDVRVGIHTGPVLLGGGVDEDGTIRGLTVNIAARMEQTAPAGALRISHDTWLQVRGVFDVQAQPPLQVKGRDEALLTYLVQRAKPRAFRVQTRGIEGLATPLVGREGELAQMKSQLDQVAAQRRLHALTLIGDPGVGKSRLLDELRGALETHAQRFWLLLGRAHPQSRLQPYGLLRDLLAWRLQIADSDSSEVAKAKLVEGLAPWLAERAEQGAHRIGQLIGLDFEQSPHVLGLEPRLLRALAFSALHDYLRGLAAGGQALAMLLEDLQWADDGSLDFVAELLQQGQELPLALVATARAELLERRGDWAQGADASSVSHRVLRLEALDAGQAAVLAHALLSRISAGAGPLQELLIAQADGNPFYMEELVNMFIDDGVIVTTTAGHDEGWRLLPDKLRQTRVPSTLVGVLQARLDALTAANRHALQQASIVGYVFWDDALAALDPLAPASMPVLQGKALVRRRAGSAFEGTPEEAFHHHLLQQVTYETVLKPARRAGHAAAAAWLAERIGDRPAEYLAITAEHYDRAGDHAKALDYFERAAVDAERRFAGQAALDYVARALDNPALIDLRQRDRLLFLRQSMTDLLGQRALQEETLEERARIAETLDDDALRADVLISRALLASRRGEETLAFDLATRSARLAQASGNADAGALALGQLAWSLYSRGDLDAARSHAQDAVNLVRQSRQRQDTPKLQLREVQTLNVLSIVEQAAGNLGRSRSTMLCALTLARANGLRRPQASLLQALGSLDVDAGLHAQALVHLQAALALALEMGWTVGAATAQYNMARCQQELGQPALALVLARAAQADAQRCESRDFQARCAVVLGSLALAAGDAAAAQVAFEQAQALFEGIDAAAFACIAQAHQAALHLAQGRLARALEMTETIANTLAAGVSMLACDEPLWPHLVCHRVWSASGDSRAASALEAAHAQLQATAARAGDEDTRRSILDNVLMHREIIQAWAAAGGGLASLSPAQIPPPPPPCP